MFHSHAFSLFVYLLDAPSVGHLAAHLNQPGSQPKFRRRRLWALLERRRSMSAAFARTRIMRARIPYGSSRTTCGLPHRTRSRRRNTSCSHLLSRCDVSGHPSSGICPRHHRPGLIFVDLLWKAIWLAMTAAGVVMLVVLVRRPARIQWQQSNIPGVNAWLVATLVRQLWQERGRVVLAGGLFFRRVVCRRLFTSSGGECTRRLSPSDFPGVERDQDNAG